MVNDGDLFVLDFAPMPPVTVPVAMTQFPHDLGFRMPMDAGRGEEVIMFSRGPASTRAAHAAARETPDVLVSDIRDWFGDRELFRN